MTAVDPNFAKKAKIIAASGLETAKYSSEASSKTLEILSNSVGIIPIIGFITSLILLGWRSIDVYFDRRENIKQAKETDRVKLNAKNGAKALYFGGLTAATVIGFAIPPLGIAMLLASTSLNILYDATKLISRIKDWNTSRKEYKSLFNHIPPEERQTHPDLVRLHRKHKENTKRIWDSAFKLALNVAMVAVLAVAVIFPPLIFPMLMTAFAIVSTGFIYSTIKAVKSFFRLRRQKTQVAPESIGPEEPPAEVDAEKDEASEKQAATADKKDETQATQRTSEEEIFHVLGISSTKEAIASEILLIDDEQTLSQDKKEPESEQEESEGETGGGNFNDVQARPEEPRL